MSAKAALLTDLKVIFKLIGDAFLKVATVVVYQLSPVSALHCSYQWESLKNLELNQRLGVIV